MLFNSAPFLFLFLPICILTYFLIGQKSGAAARIALAIFSLLFYAYWDWKFIPLIVGSIAINFRISLKISDLISSKSTLNAKRVLIIGLVFNLGLLVFFKYTNLLVNTVLSLTEFQIIFPNIILPIGISFFTFTQIAFLIDTYQKKVSEYRFWDYLLFVSYFPHQIAGPILHHKEMMDQFSRQITAKFDIQKISVGFSIFAVGLAKKVLLADPMSTFADPVFGNAEMGILPTFIESWSAVVAYALQLYLDFSAYCDMAIGISLMFGIRLPLNFNSPYKSSSIIDFWRRWHITLSRFLRDYLYFPLGGNRLGQFHRYFNLMVTMALGGLWHGASWNFLFWGVLHGLYLTVNHLWRAYFSKRLDVSISPIVGWFITFVAVLVGWVFFRATSFSGALLILSAMSGWGGVAIPQSVFDMFGFGWLFVGSRDWSGALGGVRAMLFIFIVLICVLCLPNTQQIFRSFKPSLDIIEEPKRLEFLLWTPNTSWIFIVSVLLALSINRLGNDSIFLYFNF